jgi:hypothetical protein
VVVTRALCTPGALSSVPLCVSWSALFKFRLLCFALLWSGLVWSVCLSVCRLSTMKLLRKAHQTRAHLRRQAEAQVSVRRELKLVGPLRVLNSSSTLPFQARETLSNMDIHASEPALPVLHKRQGNDEQGAHKARTQDANECAGRVFPD